MKKVLFTGLGRMGANMAAHIAAAGRYELYVHNRSTAKTSHWLAQHGGRQFDDQLQYDLVILCIGGDDDVSGLLTGEEGLIQKVKAGGCIIDHTTTSSALATEMAAAATRAGINYLDAPVSGGEAGAVNGTLSCMVGGNETALGNVREIMALYCANIVHIGDSGAGQVAKMANQFCIAGIVAGLAEAITLVQKEGVDAEKVLAAISGGAAQSWQMDNRFNTMVKGEFDFGFAIDHMIKDLRYARALAEQQGWTPQMSSMICEWYEVLSEQGCSTQDTSALLKHYRAQ